MTIFFMNAKEIDKILTGKTGSTKLEYETARYYADKSAFDNTFGKSINPE